MEACYSELILDLAHENLVNLWQGHGGGTTYMVVSSEFMGKTLQAAQLTHERFLSLDHYFLGPFLKIKVI